MENSLETTLNKNGSHGIAENSLSYRLFDASYDKEISKGSKDSLLGGLYKNITDITSNINPDASGKEVLNALEKEIFAKVKYRENSIYSRDFTSKTPSVNCVGYASVFVSCLEQIGRKDILAGITVKNDDKHAWLEVNTNGDKFEFNRQNHYASKAYGLNYLEALNANSLGSEFAQAANFNEAVRVFKGISASNGNFEIGQRNLRTISGYSSEHLNFNNSSLVNPQCNDCNGVNSDCHCLCPGRLLKPVFGDDNFFSQICLLCLHTLC